MSMQMKACQICSKSRHIQTKPQGDFHDELTQINRANTNNSFEEHCHFSEVWRRANS